VGGKDGGVVMGEKWVLFSRHGATLEWLKKHYPEIEVGVVCRNARKNLVRGRLVVEFAFAFGC
jgi:hypothetical protein